MALTIGLWIYLVLVAALLLFAVVSNALVIYCVIRYRKLRTVTHVLICNLSFSDILLAGFVMPQRLHDLSHEEGFYEGTALCKIVNFCPLFVITASIFSLVCVSFERRRAIIHSQQPQMTFSSLYKIVPLIWIFSLLVSLPTFMEYTVNRIAVENGGNSNKTMLSCGSQHMSQAYKLSNATFVVMISYIIPTILMIKNYIEVAVFLFKKIKQMNAQTSRQNSENLSRISGRIRVVKLLVLVAVIFALSWLPFFIMLLYAKITNNDASDESTGFTNLFLIALATFSTAYNVVLYVVYNPSFSRAFKEILGCKSNTVAPLDQPTTRKSRQYNHSSVTDKVDTALAKSGAIGSPSKCITEKVSPKREKF